MGTNPGKHSKGFTIIELMIATTVFSIILLLVTYGILQIGRTYYKGVTETKTQDTARAALDNITQAIQFDSGAVSAQSNGIVPNVKYVICIGNVRYSAYLGHILIDDSTHHALVQDTESTPCADNTAIPGLDGSTPMSSSATELMAPLMRVAALDVTDLSGGLYKVHIRVVYGNDVDLVNPTTLTASCDGGQINQFCAVSDLTTTVEKRVN